MKNHKRRILGLAVLLAAVCAVALALGSGVFAQGGTNFVNAKNPYAFDGIHITRDSVTVKQGGQLHPYPAFHSCGQRHGYLGNRRSGHCHGKKR